MLMGRLTKEPEVRYVGAKNTAICTFTLAVSRRFKQEGQPQADFIPIVVFGKTAEFCGKYFEKGRQVVVVGRIQIRNYDNKDGQKVYVTEIVAEECYFADSKKESRGDAAEQSKRDQSQNDGFYPLEDSDELPF